MDDDRECHVIIHFVVLSCIFHSVSTLLVCYIFGGFFCEITIILFTAFSHIFFSHLILPYLTSLRAFA